MNNPITTPLAWWLIGALLYIAVFIPSCTIEQHQEVIQYDDLEKHHPRIPGDTITGGDAIYYWIPLNIVKYGDILVINTPVPLAHYGIRKEALQ